MPDLEQNHQSDFLIEKIKEKPVNKKKLIRRMIITVSMAVIFGLVACVTFLVLEPVISNWLYPEEEPQAEVVVFPEDQEEMSPEEMLAENLPTESPEPTPDPTLEPAPESTLGPAPTPVQGPEPAAEDGEGEGEAPTEEEEAYVRLGQEQIQDILSQVTFDLDHYRQLYAALYEYGKELSRSVVTVTAVTSNIDWFSSVQESQNQCSGAIISENGIELLMLTDYSAIQSAERLLVTFYDDSQMEAQLKQYNEATNLAVLSVPLEGLSDAVRGRTEEPGSQEGAEGQTGLEDLGGHEGSEGPQGTEGQEETEGQEGMNGGEGTEDPEDRLPIVRFGSANVSSLVGTPVIAIGSPMGSSNSVSYGTITLAGNVMSAADRNYRLLLTDIMGSQNASGVLFDFQGRMIGVITNNRTGSDFRNLITAYSINDLRKTVEKMSNASQIAYLGIRGADVPKEAHLELGVPYGAYVEEFDMDSPAMHAGIQPGDVIVAIGGKTVNSFNEYSNALMDLEPGQTVELTIKRQAQEEYKEMEFSIELGGVR